MGSLGCPQPSQTKPEGMNSPLIPGAPTLPVTKPPTQNLVVSPKSSETPSRYTVSSIVRHLYIPVDQADEKRSRHRWPLVGADELRLPHFRICTCGVRYFTPNSLRDAAQYGTINRSTTCGRLILLSRYVHTSRLPMFHDMRPSASMGLDFF